MGVGGGGVVGRVHHTPHSIHPPPPPSTFPSRDATRCPGQMCFGSTVADFHTFESSFSTLLRYPLGDFDYKLLSQSRPDVAPAFFVLYMGLVFLVSMNMVVAIITIAFEEVNAGVQVEESWKHSNVNYTVYIATRWRKAQLVAWLWLARACRRACTPPHRCSCGWCGGGCCTHRRRSNTTDIGEPVITHAPPAPPDEAPDDPVATAAGQLEALNAEMAYISLVSSYIATAEAVSRQDLLK
jgi:hypothetical protein